jgi:hypothetical protein
VILECTLDGLMEKIRGEKFVDIRVWKHHRERLQLFNQNFVKGSSTHNNIPESREQYRSRTIKSPDSLERGE